MLLTTVTPATFGLKKVIPKCLIRYYANGMVILPTNIDMIHLEVKIVYCKYFNFKACTLTTFF